MSSRGQFGIGTFAESSSCDQPHGFCCQPALTKFSSCLFASSSLCSFLVLPPVQTCSPCRRPFYGRNLLWMPWTVHDPLDLLNNSEVDSSASELCGFFKIFTLDAFWMCSSMLGVATMPRNRGTEFSQDQPPLGTKSLPSLPSP